jgi:hypothetical protein
MKIVDTVPVIVYTSHQHSGTNMDLQSAQVRQALRWMRRARATTGEPVMDMPLEIKRKR